MLISNSSVRFEIIVGSILIRGKLGRLIIFSVVKRGEGKKEGKERVSVDFDRFYYRRTIRINEVTIGLNTNDESFGRRFIIYDPTL